VRKSAEMPRDRLDWVEASVRIESLDAAVTDLLALGADVEVLQPPELRDRAREVARRITELHAPVP
jgi:predicted DNA-binding transcriptional regulator YafY